jgi:hypothetical protein
MAVPEDLKNKAKQTREEGVFTLQLDDGVSLAELCGFAQDMFPGMGLENIGVWPAEEGELVVSIGDGGAVSSN